MEKEIEDKYVIECPKCKSKFDCQNEIKKWVESLEQFKDILRMLKSLATDKTSWEMFK